MPYSIVYVLGLPHTGSTLCGALIGAHSKAFSLGEPWKLRQYALLEREKSHKTAHGNTCTCGAPSIWDCSFWPQIDDAIRSASGLGLRDLDTASSDPTRFARDNQLLFDAVAAVTGATLLVDSSKRIERCRRLISSNFAPVRILHLTRRPGAQVYSIMKRSGKGPYRHALRNTVENARMLSTAYKFGAIQAHYEQLANAPEAWLRQAMAELGLEFERQQLGWAQRERHNISGNRGRTEQDGTIRVDSSWEVALKPHQKTYINLVSDLPLQLLGLFLRKGGTGRTLRPVG